MKRVTNSNRVQEVSKSRSTKSKRSEKDRRRRIDLHAPFGKESIHREKLDPNYVVGFVDGEGSFSVSIGKHKTTKSGFEVRPEFEIELRADDQPILERVLITIGCGRIYDLSYDRYGWYPHVKYKVNNRTDLINIVFPFFDKHKPQAKKAEVYEFFKEIVLMMDRKEHLTDKGFKKIVGLRDEIRKRGKKAKTFKHRI
ncbi:MAG TPA: hypothetical protein ENI66_00935 [Candidatus Yonathbacteria bacterium]|nr:hypothetical protein [Candidatus Yonathbacteria bacterium]